METMVVLILVAVIASLLTPIVTKRITASRIAKSRISTNCNLLYPNKQCSLCYLTPKQCIICNISCPDGEVKNNNDCKCKNCKTLHNDPKCSNCNLRYCTQCENGYYLNDNKICTPCPKGYYCFKDDQTKTSIKKPCPKGTSNNKIAQSTCAPCLKSTTTITGTYSDKEGGFNCTSCNHGTYTQYESQSNSCVPCPKGYYCPDGKLIPCAKGSANNQTGQTVCQNCTQSNQTTTGTYSDKEAAQNCIPCQQGTYSESFTNSFCSPCPTGYYCPQGKLIPCSKGTSNPNQNQISCSPCLKSTSSQRGTYTNSTASTKCEYCLSGTYSKQQSATSCSPCPTGYYCPDGKLIPCPSTSFSFQGAQTCTPCSSKYPNCKTCNTSQCLTCNPNYKLSKDSQKCEQQGCPTKTIKITTSSGDLCVTQYNMGDQAEFPLTGVCSEEAGYPGGPSGKVCNGSLRCWKGETDAFCSSPEGYCNRTVCFYYAAATLCSNLKYGGLSWRLPTYSEYKYFYKYSKGLGKNGLMLCSKSECGGRSGCFGPGGDSCFPFLTWTSTLYSTPHEAQQGMILTGFVQAGEAKSEEVRDYTAASVRCVAELKN